MAFEFFDHTGDIGVTLWGRSLDELFASGAAAFAEVVTDPSTIRSRRAETVELEAPSCDLLLVDFLGELLYRFEVDGLLAGEASVSTACGPTGCRLRAELRGERADPDRHPIKVLVKAITYHELAVTETANGFEARVIFDI